MHLTLLVFVNNLTYAKGLYCIMVYTKNDVRKENIMPVLTNFLSVRELTQKERQEGEVYEGRLKEQWEASKRIKEAFGVGIDLETDFGEKLYRKVKETSVGLFESTGYIPEQFQGPSFFERGRKLPCIHRLNELSIYPTVNLSQLKKMADALSFVILPIDYVDIAKVFEMYKGIGHNDGSYYTYAEGIYEAYDEFQNVIERCVDSELINPQTIYILAPLSFYDCWLEVSNEKVLSKYFPRDLFTVSTTLGLLIPAQRNLFKMAQTNSRNIQEMKQTMDANFKMLKRSVEDCYTRISWVENMMCSLNAKVDSLKTELQEAKIKVAELETKLYCMLDPVIFTVDSSVDISKPDSNKAKARIGICFGPEMPMDFFVERGLAYISDKIFDPITKIFKPVIPII